MTDRYNALTVVLDQDIRDDDAEKLMQAILQLRGVISVDGNVVNIGDYTAFQRARSDLAQKLWEVLYPKTKN